MVSRDFIIAIKLYPERQYRIAQKAGIDASTLSKIMNGAIKIKPDDLRLKRVCEILGFPSENALVEDQ